LIGVSRLSISMAGSSPRRQNMADDPRKTDHDQRVKALNEANAETAKVQQMPPTPTQEENDLMALGLMHIDDKDASHPKTDESERSARPTPEPHRPAPEPHSTSAARRS
jgi:hypothetical protein